MEYGVEPWVLWAANKLHRILPECAGGPQLYVFTNPLAFVTVSWNVFPYEDVGVVCWYTRVQLRETEEGKKEKRGKHVCSVSANKKEEYSNID